MIIGLCGRARSGKDTVYKIASSFLDKNNIQYEKLAFADPLKDEICKACKIERSFLDSHKENFRLIMRWWGTDFRRTMWSKDYWINILVEKMIHLPPSIKIVFISDVRFINEAIFIKRYGGLLIKINRDGIKKDQHQSETETESISGDYTITNNGSINDLEEIVINTINKICINQKVVKH